MTVFSPDYMRLSALDTIPKRHPSVFLKHETGFDDFVKKDKVDTVLD